MTNAMRWGRWLTWSLLLTAACGGKTSTTSTADAAVDAPDQASETDAGATVTDATTSDSAPSDVGAALQTCGPQPIFDPSAMGSAPGQRVGDITLPTLDGDWGLAEHWTGCDEVVFFFTAPGDKYKYAQAVWNSKPADLLKGSPTNVHYVFGSYDADEETATATVLALKDKFDAALAGLSEAKQAAWAGRLHFLTQVPFDVEGWLGEGLKKQGAFGLAIDRTQSWRELGALGLPGANPTLKGLIYDVQRLDYEAAHLAEQTGDQATVVQLWTKANGGNGWGAPTCFADVTLPDASQMAQFDTMVLDLAHGCKDDKDANCPDWDREAYLNVCDRTTESTDTVAAACAGTETQACACEKPDGRTSQGVRPCQTDGKSFGACQCPCDTEFARQITSYKRQGRWFTDVSPMLALLKKGGKWRFRYDTPDGWLLTASLRLSKQGKATRPMAMVPLWHGEQFDQDYNGKFKPIEVEVPAGAKKARVVAIITGHGSATDSANCAEFCPHEHRFTVGGTTVVKAHKEAGTATGCLLQVSKGAIGNQYGTWPYGRAGWCPGMDVPVWTADVPVTAGAKTTVSYEALLNGQPYVPQWGGPGDYKPVIRMSSWLEFEQ